jgi:hypothetical protein
MSKETRLSIIRQIAEQRNSFVLSYVTSTRTGLEVSMAMDSIRYIFDHIVNHKNSDNPKNHLDLFLYSNGGDGTVPWRLVTLIKDYFEEFSVLIPYRAFSAATLTALGANQIVMHPMGMLGPTDPTVVNGFNPEAPNGQKIGISVEDVTAYINLIKEEAGITHEDELIQAFNKLPEQVHPLALGNVKRSLAQSRMMANKLLSLHMDKYKDQHAIGDIIDNLTSKLYYHGHPINRKEAEDIGIKTIKTEKVEVENLIWQLYLEYEKEMQLADPFNPLYEFMQDFPAIKDGEQKITNKKKAKLVYIESENDTNVNVFEYQVQGHKAGGIINAQSLTLFQGWSKEIE